MAPLLPRRALLTLLLCAAVCSGDQLTLPDSQNGAVGGDIVFAPHTVPSQPYQMVSWMAGTTFIITLFGGQTVVGPDYRQRISLNNTTLALELRNLTSEDENFYTLTIQQDDVRTFQAKTTLKVFEPVSSITVRASETELIEFNSTVSLACSASGSALSFSWRNGGSEVTVGGRFQLLDGNRTLTINSVHRVDTGPYRCEAFNVVSFEQSPLLYLTIYYGPDNVAVKTVPAGPLYSVGTNLTLTCSANSETTAVFQWAKDGEALDKSGPELKLANVQASQSGSYTCIARNTKTLRYTTSHPVDITVLENVSEVTLTGPTEPLIEGSSSSNLTCEGNGAILSVEWMKDNQKLFPSNHIRFSDDKRSVMISPVDRTDSGVYQCTLSNPISSTTAYYTMTINCGPSKVMIDGPSKVEEGNSVTFSCTTDSVPEAVYTWEFNGTETTVTTGSFTVQHANFSHSGNYTCLAWNQVTRREASESRILVVIEKGSWGGLVLSTEAIAGIVVGILLGVAGVALLIVFFKKVKGRSKPGFKRDKQNGATQNGGEHELNYATIKHLPSNQSVVNMGGSSTQTRQGTPAMVRANLSSRGTQTNQETKPTPRTEVLYSDVKK